MCKICGCDAGAEVTATNLQTGEMVVLHHHTHEHEHEHVHAGIPHSHAHPHPHGSQHPRTPAPEHEIVVGARLLAKNDGFAATNRTWLAERRLLALNLMSAPGAGKTTLLERTIRDLKPELNLYVLEGDQATSYDGERVRNAGASVVQVNTGTGCHLDAHMVAHGLAELNPVRGAVVLIENVGNLVCPALFDLGAHRSVALLSVTEGDDKPLKYPHMFRAADLVLLNKIDLLPYVDFDVARATANAREVNPDVELLTLSARTGEGMGTWYAWLRAERTAVAGTA